MANLLEFRCTCTHRGKHPLLAMVGGSDFHVEVKCRYCRRPSTFRFPDPYSTRKKSIVSGGENAIRKLQPPSKGNTRESASAQKTAPAAESAQSAKAEGNS